LLSLEQKALQLQMNPHFIFNVLNGIQLIDNNSTVEQTIETLDNISSLAKLKNEIWVTSETDGIEVLVLPSFSFKQKINKYNSLGTNQIKNVLRDTQNTKWVSSSKGIYKLNSSSNSASNINKPKIYFESLLVNNQNVDSLLGTDNLIKFSPEQHNISIQFKSIDISNPRNIEYRFKLDTEFSSWSKNNLVQFANLNPGKYNFQVQSRNNENESTIENLSFTIDSPFYKKAWFLFSVIISLLLIAYFSLDLYIKQIHKKHQKKIRKLKLQNHLLSLEQKALQLQMNPHFIFNVLNGIKALGNSGKTDELNSTISKFSVLLRGILNNSRKEEITLKEEINLLKNYIELEQRMSSKAFTYQIITNLNNIDSDEILIPSMLIQPFIENCIQHAFESNKVGSISIEFKIEYGFLLCSIIDNGIGYSTAQKGKNNSNHKSVALDVSKERLNAISNKSSFSIKEVIKDKRIQGTEVSFKIPLKTDF
jgi:hypothetical protein